MTRWRDSDEAGCFLILAGIALVILACGIALWLIGADGFRALMNS